MKEENMVIVNVKKTILDTDPTFLFFSVSDCWQSLIFFLCCWVGWVFVCASWLLCNKGMLIYQVLLVCSPVELLRHTGWLLRAAIGAPDYYCQCFRRCNELWNVPQAVVFAVGDWSALNAIVSVKNMAMHNTHSHTHSHTCVCVRVHAHWNSIIGYRIAQPPCKSCPYQRRILHKQIKHRLLFWHCLWAKPRYHHRLESLRSSSPRVVVQAAAE